MWRQSFQNKSFMDLKLWTSWGVDPQIFKIPSGRTIFYFLTSKLTFFRKLKRISFWKCKRRSFLYLEVYFWLRFPSQGSRRERLYHWDGKLSQKYTLRCKKLLLLHFEKEILFNFLKTEVLKSKSKKYSYLRGF